MMVVDERAIHDDATVRLQSASNNVRGVRRGAPVTGWAGTAFGIGFDKEPREVRNQAINLISLLLPPGLHARIERIKRVAWWAGHVSSSCTPCSSRKTPSAHRSHQHCKLGSRRPNVPSPGSGSALA